MPKKTFTPARRIGRFLVQRKLIYDEPATVRLIFEGLIVVRAEMLYHQDAIEYTALGGIFDEVAQDKPVPLYRIEISRHIDPDTDVSRVTIDACKRIDQPPTGGSNARHQIPR